jgi:uncharacterized protein
MGLLHTLFPKVRAELLRVLFADPGREVHLRELARQSGLSIKTIQDEVQKLLRAGLLTSRRDGNRLLLRAETAHPLFPDLQQIVLKTAGLRDVLTEALRGLKGVDIAFVFGSLAGGPGNARSDVDLMVIGSIGLRTLAPRLTRASATLGREINPVTTSAENFARTRRSSAFLVDVMAKEKLFVKGTADELERLG